MFKRFIFLINFLFLFLFLGTWGSFLSLSLSQTSNNKKLTSKVVHQLNKNNNVGVVSKLSKNDLITAIHEAGHTLVVFKNESKEAKKFCKFSDASAKVDSASKSAGRVNYRCFFTVPRTLAVASSLKLVEIARAGLFVEQYILDISNILRKKWKDTSDYKGNFYQQSMKYLISYYKQQKNQQKNFKKLWKKENFSENNSNSDVDWENKILNEIDKKLRLFFLIDKKDMKFVLLVGEALLIIKSLKTKPYDEKGKSKPVDLSQLTRKEALYIKNTNKLPERILDIKNQNPDFNYLPIIENFPHLFTPYKEVYEELHNDDSTYTPDPVTKENNVNKEISDSVGNFFKYDPKYILWGFFGFLWICIFIIFAFGVKRHHDVYQQMKKKKE